MLRTMTGNFARQIMVGLSQLALMILIARLHGPEGVGIYTLAVLVPMLGAQMLTFGMQSASVYLGAQGKFGFGIILRANLLMALVVSAAFMVISVPVVMILGTHLFAGVSTDVILVGLCAFPAAFGITILPALAQAANAFRAYNLFLLIQPFAQLGAAVCIIALGGEIGALVLSYVVSCWIAFVCMVVWMSRKWGLGTGSARPFFQAAAGYGMLSHLGNVTALLNYRIAIWLSANMLGLASSGLYILAMQLAEKLWLPSQAAATVLFPRLAQLHGAQTAGQSVETCAQVARATLAVTGLIALGCVFAAELLIALFFGAQAQGAALPFVILLPGIVAWAASRILATEIAARGEARINLWIALITLISNFILLLVLMPLYGLQGAAWATTLAYGGDLLTRSLFFAYLTGNRPFHWIVPTRGDLARIKVLVNRRGLAK